MIRLEIYVGNMENTIQKFINDYSIIVNETKKAMEKEISIGDNKMELMKSEMEDFYKNVTSTMAQEQKSRSENQRELQDNAERLNEKLDGVQKLVENKTDEQERKRQRELQDNVESLNKKVDDMKKWVENNTDELERLVTPLIAFNAYGHAGGKYSSGQPVVFKNVLLNEGDCYDPATGYFTASVDAIYQFNAHICFKKGYDLKYVIRAGSNHVIRGETRAATDSTDVKCESFSVTVLVQKGQNVYVSTFSNPPYPDGDYRNSFSGSIIRRL
ncbi:hypothetical protein ACF0H5_007214 [Mactra antiquata]